MKIAINQVGTYPVYRFYMVVMVVLTMILSSSFTLGSQREINTLSKSLQSINPLERTTAHKMITGYSSSDDSIFQIINSLLQKELKNNLTH